jgi:hypothetical protein
MRTSNAVVVVLAVSLMLGLPDSLRAAYFDDNNEREDLSRLRNLRATGGELSLEERAIVEFADRVGTVAWPDCIVPETGQPVNGNAFLIQIGGRDAIITSAHVTKDAQGQLPGNCNLSAFKQANYYANFSYFLQEGPAAISDAEFRETTQATVDPEFGDFSDDFVDDEVDWMLLFLSTNISHLPAPNQTEPRGFIDFADDLKDGELLSGVIVGTDGGQASGVTTWQKCVISRSQLIVFHTCDTRVGASSSPIGIFQGEEVKFAGLHNRTSVIDSENEDIIIPLPKEPSYWNRALAASHIQREIERITGETLTPLAPTWPKGPSIDL